MERAQFEAALRRDGYLEIEAKTLEPRPANGDHGHHFSVRGLVTAGAFIITRDGLARSYGPGEIFEVPEGCLHNEAVGPEGASIVVGRKY
jgi:quercetin dioxygenase-like cupin family protein